MIHHDTVTDSTTPNEKVVALEKAIRKYTPGRAGIVEMFNGTGAGASSYMSYLQQHAFRNVAPQVAYGYFLRCIHRLEDAVAALKGEAPVKVEEKEDGTARRLLDLHKRLAAVEQCQPVKVALAAAEVRAVKDKKNAEPPQK